ncbi:GNAT family N-acetyltransferase [Roseomonas stagni]|uniref:GNAT family N-acetyltransferase n=1 Tax=Falsiroseomonas algicola TaxID=2716930 RepID=A0A6M1LKT4_9PROT|nr:GNAT family N-acetyltransferase [Falsiroseomonas algicola]NGM20817.1 GNAT family N-acetyltransferase [Falsiroseomonas algicola]
MTSRYGLEIRAATAADAPGLAELLAEAGQDAAGRVVAARVEALRQGAGTVLIAQEWGPPSGVIALHWYASLLEDRPVAQITFLLVGQDSRRRGIGRLLVKAASQAARSAGCGALEMALPEADATMRGFCEATGFVEGGARFTRSLRRQG